LHRLSYGPDQPQRAVQEERPASSGGLESALGTPDRGGRRAVVIGAPSSACRSISRTIQNRSICCSSVRRAVRDIYRWTRKIDGKTVTRLLTKEQKERYETWFDSARRIHALIAELEAQSLLIAESAEDWDEQASAPKNRKV
jgi:uncharacterized protein involved in tolerance to divalent cations